MALTTVRPQGMGFDTGRRNLIINGAMQVNQRGDQSTSAGSNTYFVDRFNVYIQATAAANVTQSTDVPSGQGFSYSAKIDVTTADTSVGASDLGLFRQVFEGQNVQQLAYGTSSAKKLTLSFWVKSSKTGTHIVEFYNSASTARQQSQSYTISAADTWEYKTITIDGDTATAIDNNTGAEFYVQWVLYAGSNYTSGTLNTSWNNVTDANRYVGQVNFFDSTSNNMFITGVQLEVGENASDFEHRPASEEFLRCCRYFYRLESTQGYTSFCLARNWSTTNASGNLYYYTPMRVNPTFTSSTVNGSNFDYSLTSLSLATNPPDVFGGVSHAALNLVGAFTNGGASHVAAANTTNEVFLAFDAEL